MSSPPRRPEDSPAPRPGPSRRVVAVTIAVLVVVLAVVVVRGRDGSSTPPPPGSAPPIGGAPGARVTEPVTPGGRITDEVLNGQNVVIAEPAEKTSRAVLFLHGAGQNSRTLFTDPTRRAVVAALGAAGFAVGASDATGDGWGSPATVAADLDLAAELRRRGRTDLVVLAESMGGLALPRVMAALQAKGAAAWYPVCNMATVLPVASFAASIAQAYGGQAVPQPGLSPVTFATQPGSALALWASPADTVVPKATNADVCASQARAAGIEVTETPTTGEHGDPSNIQPAPLVQFFQDALAK